MNYEHLILSIISFLIGALVGYIIRGIVINSGKANDMKTFVLLIVSFAWFASVIVEILNPQYHTNPMIHGLMGSIVGFFYKLDIKPKKNVKNN